MSSAEASLAAGAAAAEALVAAQQHDQQQHWGIEGSSSGGDDKTVSAGTTTVVNSNSSSSSSSSNSSSNNTVVGNPGDEESGSSLAEGLASGILPCRKRKAPEELPQIDEATAERLKRATDSLTKEQLKMLLARACSHYPAVENALYAMIEADPSSRRLMIRNVPYTATETSLKQTVEAYGPIEDFKLVIDRNTGTKTRG
ncbi:hypothetical protein EMWEY_00046540 [Eimeria maxima]|uniref:RRM domain-containing protein n=1 Tax=Eimeria maxima TaxID=5804 RepID=U6MFU3_EIMMA|nr:hypothetical protein EMWEY_00046540 [Eimeria maxima]CDJ61928.1 hypothetical protein EMWEY_00046540 [Eimeria maxima]